jgi:hypothetical protein
VRGFYIHIEDTHEVDTEGMSVSQASTSHLYLKKYKSNDLIKEDNIKKIML